MLLAFKTNFFGASRVAGLLIAAGRRHGAGLATTPFEAFKQCRIDHSSHGGHWRATQRHWIGKNVYPAIGSPRQTSVRPSSGPTLRLDPIRMIEAAINCSRSIAFLHGARSRRQASAQEARAQPGQACGAPLQSGESKAGAARLPHRRVPGVRLKTETQSR